MSYLRIFQCSIFFDTFALGCMFCLDLQISWQTWSLAVTVSDPLAMQMCNSELHFNLDRMQWRKSLRWASLRSRFECEHSARCSRSYALIRGCLDKSLPFCAGIGALWSPWCPWDGEVNIVLPRATASLRSRFQIWTLSADQYGWCLDSWISLQNNALSLHDTTEMSLREGKDQYLSTRPHRVLRTSLRFWLISRFWIWASSSMQHNRLLDSWISRQIHCLSVPSLVRSDRQDASEFESKRLQEQLSLRNTILRCNFWISPEAIQHMDHNFITMSEYTGNFSNLNKKNGLVCTTRIGLSSDSIL